METIIKKVTLPNRETYGYRERVGGEIPFLLIHGNMTSSKHWDVLIDALPASYKVLALDLRGFGSSSYMNRIDSIRDFSDDVKLFADEVGLSAFHVCGWSTGGAVAMQLAADHPGYVKSLLLLASASTRGYPFYSIDEDGLPQERLRTLMEVEQDPGKTLPVQQAYDNGDKAFLRQLWNMLIYTDNNPDENRYEEYLDDMLTQRNLAEVYQALNIFNISEKHNGLSAGTAEAQKISVPTLILWGENDRVVTRQMTEEIKEDLSGNVKISILKNCGHSPLIDDLNQLVGEIDRFLRDQVNREQGVL